MHQKYHRMINSIRTCINCKDVVKNNVKLVIDSDAPHHPVNLAFLRFGIAQVRRGWADRQVRYT
jgi:hypothetical protein